MARRGRRQTWTDKDIQEWKSLLASHDFRLLDRVARTGLASASQADITELIALLDVNAVVASPGMARASVGELVSGLLSESSHSEAIVALLGAPEDAPEASFNERVLLARVALGDWKTEIDNSVLKLYKSVKGPDAAPDDVNMLTAREKVEIWKWRAKKPPSSINSAFMRRPGADRRPGSKKPGGYWVLLRRLHDTFALTSELETPAFPTPFDSFVGRQDELRKLGERTSSSRIVTIVGPSGVGKTRLAIEFAKRQEQDAGATPYFVELEDCDDFETAVDALFRSCGTRGGKREAFAATIASAVSGVATPLIVFDNCEQLPEACGAIIERLAALVPELRVVSTSVRPLDLSGEHVLRIGGLSASLGSAEDQATVLAAGVQLFHDRANLDETDQSVSMAEEIVGCLDGLPFAIELAARSSTHRTLAETLELARGGLQGVENKLAEPERHRTIDNCIQGSLDLLDEPDSQALAKLSVFEGGWSMEAAPSVLGMSQEQAQSTLDRLIGRSLVATHEVRDRVRYSLLNVTRSFLRETHRDDPVIHEARARHWRFFADTANESSDQLGGVQADAWLEMLDADVANVDAAIEYAVAECGPSAMLRFSGLWWYWFLRGQWSEVYEALELGLKTSDTEVESLQLPVLATSTMAWASGRTDRAEELFDLIDAGSDARQGWIAAQVEHIQGHIAHHRGEWERASQLFHSALTYWDSKGNSYWEALLRDDIGYVLLDIGEYEAAKQNLEEAWILARRIGDRQAEGNASSHLCAVMRQLDEPDRAVIFGTRAVRTLRRLGYRRGLATALRNLADAEIDLNEFSAAKEHLDEAGQIQVDINHEAGFMRSRLSVSRWASSIGDLDSALKALAFSSALVKFRRLPLTANDEKDLAAVERKLVSNAGPDRKSAVEQEAITTLELRGGNLRQSYVEYEQLADDYF